MGNGSVPPRGSGWVTRSFLIDKGNCVCHSDEDSFALILTMWNDTDTPLAYFISFRTYGSWLHGDSRGSIDRFHNHYRGPYIPPNETWRNYIRRRLKAPPLKLEAKERKVVGDAIRKTCEIRNWILLALNVRTNHVHTVVKADRLPGLVLNAFKANATTKLRAERLWLNSFSPWAGKGSKRRLWNEKSLKRAINYVLNGQGDSLPDFDE